MGPHADHHPNLRCATTGCFAFIVTSNYFSKLPCNNAWYEAILYSKKISRHAATGDETMRIVVACRDLGR